MSYSFNNMLGGNLIQNTSVLNYVLIALVLTAGTAFLMWLGEQITQFGVGNGISIIIFAGILSSMPNSLIQFYQQSFVGADDNYGLVKSDWLILRYDFTYCWCSLCTTSNS